MHVSQAGSIVQSVWATLPERFPGLQLDGLVVMPNHIHGILVLTEQVRYKGGEHKYRPKLGDIVRMLKGATTYQVRRRTPLYSFAWQKGFHDLIVRNQKMLAQFHLYMEDNPLRWMEDTFYRQQDQGGR